MAVIARVEKKRRPNCRWRLPLRKMLFFVLLAVCVGCHNAEFVDGDGQQSGRFIEIDGVAVPVFGTAAEQLNYTRSWFADLSEKRAALRGFLQLFPKEKQFCGRAALDLAYLELGRDHRFSRANEGFAAIKAYKDIASSYADIPEVAAKAYWYIGWIYADLLADRQKGMEYYRLVAEKFPEEKVMLLPPAPWVSIIYPDDGVINRDMYTPPRNTWAALALMEIIRNSEDKEQSWNAFVRMWRRYRQSSATGYALVLILERRIRVDQSLEMAREYLQSDLANVHVPGDIRRLVDDISLRGGEA